VKCSCEDYKLQCEKLFTPLMFEVARNPQSFPKLKDGSIDASNGMKGFEYCPWCGKKLMEE
jgi:hypothetical protein